MLCFIYTIVIFISIVFYVLKLTFGYFPTATNLYSHICILTCFLASFQLQYCILFYPHQTKGHF